MKKVFFLLLPLILFACEAERNNRLTEKENSKEAMEKPYLVMVSMDGFRYDYIQKFKAKNLERVFSDGIRAESMIPCFPSSTFPNHYSLATGMYPKNHGIVSNSFFDPSRKEFYQIRDRQKVEDGSFYRGTPLWVLAERSGMLAASFFWVGSEADVQGIRPTYYYRYDSGIPNQRRVDQVIEWLELPPAKRPHMITLYFSDVDSKGHKHGPDHPETEKAVLQLDALIGQLDERLSKTGLDVSLIVTSDHGMQQVNQEEVILPRRLAKLDGFEKVVQGGTQWAFHSQDSLLVDSTFERLKKLSEDQFKGKYVVFRQEEAPEQLKYDDDPRIGQFLMASISPYILSTWGYPVIPGYHGYDPYDCKNMHTIFMAKGSKLVAGKVIPSFENIQVYPLAAKILELEPPADIDGSIAHWDSLGVWK
ncbi:MAG: ectonucleotide pyrophosphatase/phosphodiesterase [Bacteroidia bacterium]|nr:ectonucleotide pyrophosphatase/phosphodiesterase [Bacteroidia bacterium]